MWHVWTQPGTLTCFLRAHGYPIGASRPSHWENHLMSLPQYVAMPSCSSPTVTSKCRPMCAKCLTKWLLTSLQQEQYNQHKRAIICVRIYRYQPIVWSQPELAYECKYQSILFPCRPIHLLRELKVKVHRGLQLYFNLKQGRCNILNGYD